MVDADVSDERFRRVGPSLARGRPVRDERERVGRSGANQARDVGGLVVLLVGVRVRRTLGRTRPVDVELVLLARGRVYAGPHDRTGPDLDLLADEGEIVDRDVGAVDLGDLRDRSGPPDPRRVPVGVVESRVEVRVGRVRTKPARGVLGAHRPPIPAVGDEAEPGRVHVRLLVAREGAAVEHDLVLRATRCVGHDELVRLLGRAPVGVVHDPAEGGRAGHGERGRVVVDGEVRRRIRCVIARRLLHRRRTRRQDDRDHGTNSGQFPEVPVKHARSLSPGPGSLLSAGVRALGAGRASGTPPRRDARAPPTPVGSESGR